MIKGFFLQMAVNFKFWIHCSIALLLFVTFSSNFAVAQNCDLVYNYFKTKQRKYSIYNHKDKIEGILEHRVLDIKEKKKGPEIILKSALFSRDSELAQLREFEVACKKDSIYFAPIILLEEDALKRFQNMDFEFKGKEVVFPQELSPDLQLPDAFLNIMVLRHERQIATIQMVARKRKTGLSQLIKTEAGDFICFPITYEFEVKTKALGINFRSQSLYIDFFSPEHGIIKRVEKSATGKKILKTIIISSLNSN